MTDPITNILTAARLATGADPGPVDRIKVAEARRVAAVLMRDLRGMSRPEIAEVLDVTQSAAHELLSSGLHRATTAEAVRRARKLLAGANTGPHT